MKERDIFLSALEFEEPAARYAHLQAACGDDAPLLARVEALLASHEHEERFLNTPIVKQLAGCPAELFGATIQSHDDSTAEEELDAAASNSSEPPTIAEDSDAAAGVLSLGFLQTSSRPDSLGRLAHYDVLEILGKGASGTVLKAFDEKLQRMVALKVMSPELAATEPARKRFLREARAAAKIRHENVVTIYAVEDDSLPYLVMEYIPGQTLQQRLDEHGPLELPDVLRLGKQIADGLAAAHAEQLIHRDVKPTNILLETNVNDRVKVSDFGLARTADDTSVTQSGMIAGTPMYMAPEQAQGCRLDPRADLFSLGSVLYHMITGRPPFRAPNAMAVLKRVTEDTARPIPEMVPETPLWMCELIATLHQKNPDDRYASAGEVGDLLSACLTDLEQGRIPNVAPIAATQRLETPSSSRPTRQPRRFFLKAASVLLILLIGLGLMEATGVTQLTSTVIRLATGAGTLIIETDDPGLEVTIRGGGQEVTIRGGGIEELTLQPGKYKVAASKDGKPVKQEIVSISRNGRKVVRISLESIGNAAKSDDTKPPQTKPFTWPKDAPPLAMAPFDGEQAEKHQQAWAKYLRVPVEISNSIGAKLRLIPPGKFRMRLKYDVTISRPFQIGVYEVTVAQFRAFVDDTGYKTSAELSGNGQRPDGDGEWRTNADFTWRHKDVNQGDDYPVGQLSWEDAVTFCEWLSRKEGKQYRLPTEAEWEWACRAGSLNRYQSGDDPGKLAEYAWCADNADNQTHPVGLKKPNPWGLFDMNGNVCEFCFDWHTKKFPSEPMIDPRGPADGKHRVTRGGGYLGNAKILTFGLRGLFVPSGSMIHFGLRIVCEVVP